MAVKSKILQGMLALAAMGFSALIIGCLVVIGIFYAYSRDLPDPNQLAKYEPSIVTRLYANNGKLLAEYATEHRLYLPLDAIPRRVIDAFLAAEDKGFYRHGGVDFMSIARAIVVNITQFGEGRVLVGGSTITQQVVKNFLLTNERSFERKIKEAILAFRMDRIFSKDRILELYLNEIYLGNRSYGVAAAALNYFNKSLEDLTLAESAFLAGLPKGPANYHPQRHYENAVNRRRYVLGRMESNGYITAEESEIADKAPITMRLRDKTDAIEAQFFAEEVRRQLASSYGDEVLYEGGLYVKTTVEPEYQQMADEALRHTLMEYDRRHGWRGPISHFPNFSEWRERLAELATKTPIYEPQRLGVVQKVSANEAKLVFEQGSDGVLPLEQLKWARKYISDTERGGEVKAVDKVLMVGDVLLVEPVEPPKEGTKSKAPIAYKLLQIPRVNGALVAMNPHTGRVVAMSGGYSSLRSEFNRATQARRQPGSAFKPFVYLSALESGMSPNSRIMDAPISIPQGADLPDWQPQNYSGDFLGPITMRRALEKSRNASTVYLATLLGIDRIQEIGQRFGIYDKLPPHYATVLGSQETTLLRLVNAYAMLVNGGKKVTPQLIERIDDRYGETLYRRDSRKCESCAYRNDIPAEISKSPPQINDNRATVVDSASAFQMTYMLQGVVERGTAIRAKSLGLPLGGKTGTTNDARDAWFIGFSPDLVVGLYVGFDAPRPLGYKETGSSVALPGFIEFVGKAFADKPVRPFPLPEGVKFAKIHYLSGLPAYYAGTSDGLIYEAFKYYQDPYYVNHYPLRKADATALAAAQEGEAQPPMMQGYAAPEAASSANNGSNLPWLQQVQPAAPVAQQPAATPPRRRSWRQPPQQAYRDAPAPQYSDEEEIRPQPSPAIDYVERALQLRQQRAAQRYQSGVGGSRYYQQQQQPRAPQPRVRPNLPSREYAPSQGTGGYY